MAGRGEIGADALRDIGVDGERVAPTAFAHDAQRVEVPVLVKIFHRESREIRAAEAHLQAYRENRAVAQPLNRVFCRGVEQFGRVRLGKSEGRSFPSVNRGAFDICGRLFSTWW